MKKMLLLLAFVVLGAALATTAKAQHLVRQLVDPVYIENGDYFEIPDIQEHKLYTERWAVISGNACIRPVGLARIQIFGFAPSGVVWDKRGTLVEIEYIIEYGPFDSLTTYIRVYIKNPCVISLE